MSLDSEYEARLKSYSAPSHETYYGEHYSDRYIPTRHGRNLETSYHLHTTTGSSESSSTKDDNSNYFMALKTEMIGTEPISPEPTNKNMDASGNKNFFSFKYQQQSNLSESLFSLSPIGLETQKFLSGLKKTPRKISKIPYKVLEAPRIQDDYYLNLVDWSSQNIIAVGLFNSVYMWNATTSQVVKLCEFEYDTVTSVNWNRGSHLAIGTQTGTVQIWDVARQTRLRVMSGHKSRVGALAWNSHILTSGGRDHMIFHRDVRMQQHVTNKLIGHKQEICGLKWSPDGQYLASGGNDNHLLVWDASLFSSDTTPLHRFSEHIAAVKAIAWSPHQRGVLASGGGTADKCIRFWNTTSSNQQNFVDTGSQVCNLAWSKTVNELVSTHGFSQNQVIIWSHPNMNQIATLTGHTMRVLYLAMSPDGQTIVTGAGDETLRFWNVFPGIKDKAGPAGRLSPLYNKIEIR